MEEESKEKEHVCKFCSKRFPSGKALGGHIRIHTSLNSVASDSGNSKNPKRAKKNDKRLVDERAITALKQEQLCCRKCGEGFDTLKALWNHRSGKCEGEKRVMDDSQSDTETCSGPTRKRSKRMMKQSNSESFSNGSSSSEISQAALNLLGLSMHREKRNLVVNSLAESSENNSEILETKKSSGEELKMMKNKVAVDDQLRSAAADDDNGAILSDSYSSDSDYFMNGKKSDSDTSVDESPRNTGVTGLGSGSNRFKNGDELGVKEGGSKYELRKSKKVVLPSYESDSCADTNSKIHRSPMVKKASGANKNSKGHECPICAKVFKSGQALGGHKRSHSFDNQEQRIKHKAAADMRIDLNFPAMDDDDDDE